MAVNILKNVPKPNYESPHEHSEFSPSGSKRWIQCPASIKMCRTAPHDHGTNFYAEEGTAAHEASAWCLDEEKSASAAVGMTFNDFVIDMTWVTNMNKYIDYVNSRVGWNGHMWIENRVSLEHLKDGMFGTADAIIVNDDGIEIIDLKWGKGIGVEATDNYQLKTYAIGVLAHLGRHGLKFPNDFSVTVTIVQPRKPHDEGPIRSWTTDVGHLREFQKVIKFAIEEAESDNPSFGPSEDNCRWCGASAFCKAHAQNNLNIAKLEFAEFEKSPREFKQDMCGSESLTIEEMTSIAKHSKAIKSWVDGIVEYMLGELKAGRKVPGYKLVHGRSIRAWEDADAMMRALREYGVDEERLINSKPKSPAMMEKELNDEEFAIIANMIFKPTGKITIAEESDGRKPVDPNHDAISEWK